jgi:hypothetical protein
VGLGSVEGSQVPMLPGLVAEVDFVGLDHGFADSLPRSPPLSTESSRIMPLPKVSWACVIVVAGPGKRLVFNVGGDGEGVDGCERVAVAKAADDGGWLLLRGCNVVFSVHWCGDSRKSRGRLFFGSCEC